jgi:hypothetical protein
MYVSSSGGMGAGTGNVGRSLRAGLAGGESGSAAVFPPVAPVVRVCNERGGGGGGGRGAERASLAGGETGTGSSSTGEEVFPPLTPVVRFRNERVSFRDLGRGNSGVGNSRRFGFSYGPTSRGEEGGRMSGERASFVTTGTGYSSTESTAYSTAVGRFCNTELCAERGE